MVATWGWLETLDGRGLDSGWTWTPTLFSVYCSCSVLLGPHSNYRPLLYITRSSGWVREPARNSGILEQYITNLTVTIWILIFFGLALQTFMV